MSHTYVLSWDHLGLEACINISDIEKEKMWEVLKETQEKNLGRGQTVDSIVNMLMLRARANSHRHYEIYAIDTDSTISATDLKAMFDEDPQGSADLIRQRGRILYSDRLSDHHIKIR
jgi:hypothetical protein